MTRISRSSSPIRSNVPIVVHASPRRTVSGRSYRAPTIIDTQSRSEDDHPHTRVPTHPTGGTYHPITSDYGDPEGRGVRAASPDSVMSRRAPTVVPAPATHVDERDFPDNQTPRTAADAPLYVPPSVAGDRDTTVPDVHHRPEAPGSSMRYVPPPDHGGVVPAHDRWEEENQARQEELEGIVSRMQQVAHEAEGAEDLREQDFRRGEEDRQRLFEDAEARREQEARERHEQLIAAIEAARHPALPAPSEAPLSAQPTGTGEPTAADTASIIESVHRAASLRASDIMDNMRTEREEMAREREEARIEREALINELQDSRNRGFEERDERIRNLEEELAAVRAELENERAQKATEEAENRERDRAEFIERDESLRAQLGDITNLVSEQRQAFDEKRDLMDDRWQQKLDRRTAKDSRWDEMNEAIARLRSDMEADRQRCEDTKVACNENQERLLQELQRQNAEQQELLRQFADSWRNEAAAQHEATIGAVNATADEKVRFNVQGYLDEFSKALASEVRMLLGEVGKLREERRALQHELGFLLCMKSKYGPGGEFDAEWKPAGPPPVPEAPPEMAPPEPPQPVRPGWRTVPQRMGKRSRRRDAGPPPPPPGPPQHHHMPPGMMGMGPDPRSQVTSWPMWQPDPGVAPTPPSVEPTLLVPNAGSPGLFGPRSPRSSQYHQ